jgi:HD-GYP domain-containing protein (c-di-GMP phosphodiesterase class II)
VVRIAAYATAMEVCDPALGAHAARVAANAEAVALRLGWNEERLEALRLGAALHDVGKVSVRQEVLTKPGSLDDDELAEIRAHPVEGMWLLAGVPSLAPALPYVLFHHERWDGDGYPTRRAGAAIPLEGRILAVADAFDAMTSGRPYRPSLTAMEAAAEIRRCTAAQFDPDVAEAFLAALDAGEIVWGQAAVAA